RTRLLGRGRASLGVLREVAPARSGRDPEHTRPTVLVLVLQQRLRILLAQAVRDALGEDRAAPLLERVGHVLEEHEPQDHVLVLARVHGAAQLVRGLPERVLELLHGGRRARRRHDLLLPRGHFCSLPRRDLVNSPAHEPGSSLRMRTTPVVTPSTSTFSSSSRYASSHRAAVRRSRTRASAAAMSSASPAGTIRTSHDRHRDPRGWDATSRASTSGTSLASVPTTPGASSGRCARRRSTRAGKATTEKPSVSTSAAGRGVVQNTTSPGSVRRPAG